MQSLFLVLMRFLFFTTHQSQSLSSCLLCVSFLDGQFPINLTRIQVEKDHAFLEQADIDALIRRLNILNRCADKMDEIRSLVSALTSFLILMKQYLS